MQAYVVVWQKMGETTCVLVALKKVYGSRFGGEEVEPSVLNYAGQWVFPGGKVEGERPDQAARREFREETGHRLRWDVKDSQYVQPDRYHGILYVQSADIETMAATINESLRAGTTADDELERVAVVSVELALRLFSEWIPLDEGVEGELARRSRYYNDRSWFVAALKRL